MPPTLPIKDIENYFLNRIRSANSVLNLERIERSLRGVERSTVEAELLLGPPEAQGGGLGAGRNRRVVVSEDRLCPVCMKRFGGSAIRVHPDGRVVHYGCYDSGERRGMGIRQGTAGRWGG